jgi:hypothetical protein
MGMAFTLEGTPPFIKARIAFAQAVEDFIVQRYGMGWNLFY